MKRLFINVNLIKIKYFISKNVQLILCFDALVRVCAYPAVSVAKIIFDRPTDNPLYPHIEDKTVV